MRMLKTLVLLVVATGLGNMANAALSEDGIDKVTYSMFKGK